MTFNVYKRVINCMGILIDLFEVDTIQGCTLLKKENSVLKQVSCSKILI